MAIPEFQAIMLPLLMLTADGEVHRISALRDKLAAHFRLTDAEHRESLPSGQSRFYNRVSWARSDLGQAGLLESPTRGNVRITDRGRSLLAENPPSLSRRYLQRYPEFVAFTQRTRATALEQTTTTGQAAPKIPQLNAEPEATETPDETIERAYAVLQTTLADELLERMKQLSPAFFEKLVVELLLAMGYGGTRRDAARVVGQSGDGGIDGVINEDRLGLDTIYVQAKRWEGSVGRPAVQNFAGSLAGRQASKGVFITTSNFTTEAHTYVEHLPMRIVLIDGRRLATLMIEHGVGVSVTSTYLIRRIDSDYFTED